MSSEFFSRADPIAPRGGSWAPHRVAQVVAAVLVLVALGAASLAVSAKDSKANASLAAALSEQRTQLDQAKGLSDEQRKLALQRIDEAAARLEEAARIDAQVKSLRDRIERGPGLLSRGKQAAEVAGQALDARTIEAWSEQKLETELSESQRKLDELRRLLAEKDRELNQYLAQTRNGGAELADLQQQLSDLKTAAGSASGSGSGDLASAIEQNLRAAREQALQAREQQLSLQRSNLSLLIDLARMERETAAARVDAFEQRVSSLRASLQKRRQSLAEANRLKAEEQLNDAPAAIRSLQAEISAFAAEQARLVRAETEFQRENERVVRLTEQVKQDYGRIQRIVELGGSTVQVSSLLQKRRALAPSVKTLNQKVLSYQQMLSDAGLRQLQLDEQLRDSEDAESRIEKTISAPGSGQSAAEQEAVRTAARAAWVSYRDTVLALWKAYTRYLGTLSKLDADTRALALEARAYRAFIDDRLLWLPSTESAPLDQPLLLLAGLEWLVRPAHLELLARDGLLLINARAPLVGMWLLGGFLLLGLHRRALRGLKNAAAATRKIRSDSFLRTFAALGHTLVLILTWPWFLVGAGLLLGSLSAAATYTLVLAAGLQGAGHTFLFLNTLRQLCRADGVARAHLHWNPVLADQLGWQARWLLTLAPALGFLMAAGAVGVPSEFVQLAGIVQDAEPGMLSLARVALIAQMLLLAIALHRIWRREGAVMQAFEASPERAAWVNYHLVWFALALLVPLGLALAAASGYFYTAAFLTAIWGSTLWLLLTLVILKDLLLRGLYLAQRRQRFAEAVQYREEARQDAALKEDDADADMPPVEDQKLDYHLLGEQARRLVQMGYTISLLAGLWLIWVDVVPAFGFLNQVELPISTTKLIDGVSREVPLTLGDMVAGLVLGGLALFAARNVPALLELTLLQRLPINRASRYAVTTLTQYLVAMIGVVITFKALGLQWSSIQWLVAALSVGLGFGLQEIVANFVSGIILLFEQPIRVGDVVTVDGTTGTVSRIRIRATTIVNWERQELVIPNKTFITGQLINWTLSDEVNRVFITVGVSYDADTRKAMELIAEAAKEHPQILDDPPPRITFEGFGDNALTLNLRGFLGEVGSRLQTITELHQAILDKFRAAGIEIAFPQLDVHFDTSQPIELLLRRKGAEQKPG